MKETKAARSGNHPRRKRVKVPSPDSLANVALYYLSRFAASENSLRRVLENRLRRAAMAHPDFAEDRAAQNTLRAAIDSIVAQHKKTGALDDAAYAAMKVRSLRRSGKGSRFIAQRLQQKGVDPALAASALRPEGENENEEREAATLFARKRGMGPFRKTQTPLPPNARQKEFAAMARAGFSYDIAKDVLGAESEEEF